MGASIDAERFWRTLVVIPRHVNEMILRTERDELVGGEQCALDESAVETAVPTDEVLLHSGVRLARDANNRDDQEVPHTSNENKISHRSWERGCLEMIAF